MMLGHRQIKVISTRTACIHFADHSIVLCTECLRMCPAVLVLLHADSSSILSKQHGTVCTHSELPFHKWQNPEHI